MKGKFSGGWGTSLHNLIFSYFCNPYNDKIVEWMEDSYNKNVQGNGKIMLALFLNDDDKVSMIYFFYFSIYYHSC